MKKYRVQILLLLTFLLATCTPQAKPTEVITPTSTPVTFAFGPQTADEAQELLTQAEKTILDVSHHLDYRSQPYLVAEYAAWDALHRFPNDLRAKTWKWKFAYYAALSGDSESANDVYTELISNAVNEKKIAVADIPSWFQSGEAEKTVVTPYFMLEVKDFLGQEKNEKYLIQLGSKYSDSCYLLSKSPDGYSVFVLYDGFSTGYTPMDSEEGTDCQLSDLTNDNIQEAGAKSYFRGAFPTTATRVFDISSLPPKPLPFDIISVYNDKYALYSPHTEYLMENGKIRIKTTDDIPNCFARIIQTFEWDGVEFASVNISIQIDKKNTPLKECLYRVLSQTGNLSVENRVHILDEAIRVYEPFVTDNQERQILEELRIRKGLTYLFAEQPDKTRAVFQEILQSPYQKDGIWQRPIQNFLNQYKSQKDIYRACAALTVCDAYTSIASHLSCGFSINLCASDALGDIFESAASLSSFDTLIEYLKSWGVEVVEQNRVDLDLDGKDEIWFTIALPESRYYEYLLRWVYVASDYPNGVHIFQTGDVINVPPDFQVAKIDENRFFVKYWERGNFVWSRNLLTNEPSLRNLPYLSEDYPSVMRILNEDAIRRPLELREKILAGNDVHKTYVEYLRVKYTYNDACPDLKGVIGLEYNCGIYYFDLGFAAELAGDEKTAREMYTIIVEQYPDHPLALLAKNKLKK